MVSTTKRTSLRKEDAKLTCIAGLSDSEVWKEIEFGDGRWSISNHGRVKHNAKGNLLSGSVHKSRRVVNLHYSMDGHRYRKCLHIARLVYTTFANDLPSNMTTQFKDKDEMNCHIDNIYAIPCSAVSKSARRQYLITPPTGKNFVITGIEEWCDINGYDRSLVNKSKGKVISKGKLEGYRIERID